MNLSTPSSFSSNNSHDFVYKSPAPTVRCLVDIIRRMLCSRSLSTHPSDQAIDLNRGEGTMVCKDDPDSTPGIVARLMGLDFLPERSVSKIGRSRSANSVENRGEGETVKRSQSFREIPKYVELQDDEFFILSFERGTGIKESRTKMKKRREKKTETKKNRADEGENRAEQIVSCRGGDDGESDTQVKMRRKSKDRSSFRIIQVDSECSSDDLSPISVLDYGEFIRDPAVTSSDDSCSVCSISRSSSNPRRKLSTDLHSVPREELANSLEPHQKIIEGSLKKALHSEEFSDLLCIDIMKKLGRESNWAQKRIGESEGIGSELEVEIWDLLLDEVLDSWRL